MIGEAKKKLKLPCPLGIFTAAVDQEYRISRDVVDLLKLPKNLAALPIAMRQKLLPNSIDLSAFASFCMPLFTVGSLFIIFGYVVVFAVRNLKYSLPRKSLPLPRSIYLHLSIDVNALAVTPSEGRPAHILTVPFHKIPCGNWPKEVALRNIIYNRQVMKAAWATLCCLVYFLWNRKFHLLIFVAMAPNWFLLFYALRDGKSREIWISNHYDRWAVLVDSISSDVVMVQHGSLATNFHQRYMRGSISYRRKLRLRNVKKIFVTNEKAKNDFLQMVLDYSVRPEFVVRSRILRCDETLVDEKGRQVILIIGSPHLHSALKKLTIRISARWPDRFVLIYRPHPRELGAASFKYPEGLKILRPHNCIPAADFVIDYGSSFLDEILRISSPVVIGWPLGLAESLDAVLDEIGLKVDRDLC